VACDGKLVFINERREPAQLAGPSDAVSVAHAL